MTPIMKRTENKENAVSPVVGVMLMLVVTIVIAAVVTLFATGVVTSTEKAPVAVLDVNIYKSANVGGTMSSTYAPDFTIDHIAGDPLKTSDLKITVDWETKEDEPRKVTNVYTKSGEIEFDAEYGSPAKDALYLNDMSVSDSYWGNVTLSTGDHIQTYANMLKQDYILAYGGGGTTIVHEGSPFFDAVMGLPAGDNQGASATEMIYTGGAAEKLAVGTLVHVVITHVPSGSILFDKEVRVQ